MRRNKEINEFDFFIDLKTARTINIEDKLLLIDNLNEEPQVDVLADLNFQKEILEQDIPIKINFAVILYCLEGEMRLQLNLREITVKKNCICGIMPGSIGRLYYISNNFRTASFFFSGNSYKSTLDIQHIIRSQHLLFNNPVVELEQEKMNEFIEIYKILQHKLSDKNFKYKLELADAYLQVLKVYWEDSKEQYVASITKSNPSRKKVIFDAFLNEIVQHYREERGIVFYAEKLFISPKYLSKVVKDISNRQPSDWIRELVILDAKVLLQTQQYTVQQISEQLNFTSPSFFGRYFKEAVGCTPKNYQTEV